MLCAAVSCCVVLCCVVLRRLCQLCFALRYAVLRLLSAVSSGVSPSAVGVDVAVLSCCVLVPSALSLTALSSHVAPLLATVCGLVALLCPLSPRRRSAERVSAPQFASAAPSTAVSVSSSPTLFVSLYRCGLLLSTAIAILGVDFVVFPRRLAKTEEFGVSPMDAGVGGFMFAAALTAPAARRATHQQQQPALLSSVRRQLPVVLLGCARLLAVKWANYQEHVTEYGVHWNFFFTLAAGQRCDTHHSVASGRATQLSGNVAC